MNVNYQHECIGEIIVNNIRKGDRRIINSISNYKFDEDGKCPVIMHFYDGIAVATDNSGLVMIYPSLKQVLHSKKMQNTIFDGSRKTKINQLDVALVFGKLKKYNIVADYNVWIKQNNNVDIDITAIYDINGRFLFDVLEADYKEMFNEGLVYDGVLCEKLSWQRIDKLQAKYGALWIDCVIERSKNNNIISEYERLYDGIQSVTNDIFTFVGFKLMSNDIVNEQTKILFESLSNAASNLADIAHEVEEHLAWD